MSDALKRVDRLSGGLVRPAQAQHWWLHRGPGGSYQFSTSERSRPAPAVGCRQHLPGTGWDWRLPGASLTASRRCAALLGGVGSAARPSIADRHGRVDRAAEHRQADCQRSFQAQTLTRLILPSGVIPGLPVGHRRGRGLTGKAYLPRHSLSSSTSVAYPGRAE